VGGKDDNDSREYRDILLRT
jgi:hypothetical protein